MRPALFGPAGRDRQDELAAVGPVIDILIQKKPENSSTVPARGLIDTGASAICIDRRIAIRLGLRAIDITKMSVVGGDMIDCTKYIGWLNVPALNFLKLVPFYGVNMKNPSHDVLLGRSFLRNFIVTFDGPAGVFHFARPTSSADYNLDDDFAT